MSHHASRLSRLLWLDNWIAKVICDLLKQKNSISLFFRLIKVCSGEICLSTTNIFQLNALVFCVKRELLGLTLAWGDILEAARKKMQLAHIQFPSVLADFRGRRIVAFSETQWKVQLWKINLFEKWSFSISRRCFFHTWARNFSLKMLYFRTLWDRLEDPWGPLRVLRIPLGSL